MTRPAEVLQTPLQFLKGVGPRQAADFARAGLRTPSKTCSTGSRSATKIAAVCSRSRRCARADRVDGRRDRAAAACAADAAPGLQDLRGAVRDDTGAVRARVVQLSRFCTTVRAGTSSVVLYGTLERNPSTACSSRTREFEMRRRATRPTRCTPAASCRSTSARGDHAEDAAAARARGAPARCRPICRIRCRRRCAHAAARCRAAARRSARSHFPPADARSTS